MWTSRLGASRLPTPLAVSVPPVFGAAVGEAAAVEAALALAAGLPAAVAGAVPVFLDANDAALLQLADARLARSQLPQDLVRMPADGRRLSHPPGREREVDVEVVAPVGPEAEVHRLGGEAVLQHERVAQNEAR